MSVRVNLLPRADTARTSAKRQWAFVGVGALVLLAVLAVLLVLQLRQVDDARDQLAAEQGIVASLRAEEAALQAYADLDQRIGLAQQRVVTALGAQATMAGVLQDLALVMPSNAAITTMSVNLSASGQPTFGPQGPIHGSVSMSGEALTGHAPGVERVLLALDQVAAFRDVYFTTSTLDESAAELLDDQDGELAVFNVDLNLGPEVLTRRFVNGVTEGQG